MTTGERIQQLRKTAGLSQEQLADIVGVSRQAVSKWETDQSSPDIDNILALSKAFAVSTDELLGNNADTTKASRPRMEDVLKMNTKKRLFTVGWLSTLAGLLLLIVEFFLLFTLQRSDMVLKGEWYTNAMDYAQQPPMPAVFFITAIIILAGVCLTAAGLKRQK